MEIKDVPLHSERVTVWCGFMEGCIIGPYFFENDIEQAVTVNGQRYYEMLDNFFIPQVEAMDVADIHFQQDGATCHTTRENMTLQRRQGLATLNGLQGPQIFRLWIYSFGAI